MLWGCFTSYISIIYAVYQVRFDFTIHYQLAMSYNMHYGTYLCQLNCSKCLIYNSGGTYQQVDRWLTTHFLLAQPG